MQEAFKILPKLPSCSLIFRNYQESA